MVTQMCGGHYLFPHLGRRAGLRTDVVTSRCKRFGVPVEKIYNKTQRERHRPGFVGVSVMY